MYPGHPRTMTSARHSTKRELKFNVDLLRAARTVDVRAVRALLAAGASPIALDKTGSNAFAGIGPHRNRGAIIQMLVMAGGDPNHQDVVGCTPLMLAVVAGDASYVRALLRAGASANLLNGNGESALTFAIVWSRDNIARILLRHGVRPDFPRTPWTPLMYAASEGNTMIAKMLLRHGANPRRRDAYRRTALEIAEAARHGAFVAFWRHRFGADGK